ncbi:hypothetical protein ACIG0D_22435 [Streptomyces sp. NPDC052773]|uniref:hypothetical protein n=1 Tax=Streptomyces sp. NPDC052773 TaxID=3365693 RepID=UPI0037D92D1D
MRLTKFSEATDAYWAVPRNAEERREWIAANKDIIAAAAQRSGLPPDMVAGIAWQEVGGQRGCMDDGVDTIRGLARDGWLSDAPESLPRAARWLARRDVLRSHRHPGEKGGRGPRIRSGEPDRGAAGRSALK